MAKMVLAAMFCRDWTVEQRKRRRELIESREFLPTEREKTGFTSVGKEATAGTGQGRCI